MNRQLKFREWLGKEFHCWGFMEDGSFILPTNIKGPQQQFTGLLDKNGKEIYEGDVVKLHDHPTGIDDCKTRVVFMRGSFVAEYNGILLSDYGTAWTEVIGNVFENPDLLK